MKRKFLKALIIIGILIILSIGALLTYLKTALPNVGEASAITVAGTTEQVERGRYLANNVMLCIDCHSERNWEIFSGPLVPDSEGKGGEIFDQSFGFPGKYIAPNITPYGLKDWTDGEIFRAITTGVSRDGHALFPIMPHPNFGMSDSTDILAVIAYLRTLPAIEHKIEKSTSDFPMNFIINTIPKKASFTAIPDKANKVAYGQYLVTAASCRTCHTNEIKGKEVGEAFAGAREFVFPNDDVLRSMNITPHITGIGNWTEEMFVQKFKLFADSSYIPQKPEVLGYQTMMPWSMYGQMASEDLSAIYAYLRTVPPVENKVEKYTAAN
ncbi:MAG: cytochrome c [Bacteroidota bacterium]|nr:cytochrome c [Bacteroidota bacterium]